ncbi:FRAT-87 protein [Faecalibaculum rodentium]|uniref:FRAT-87 protein n=1 Tax=Faecalibaculum rodentium TaxID=1702221 RepID=UPI0025AF5D9F|nr:FRAT-87 protein [Faecalibaculum rodentium]
MTKDEMIAKLTPAIGDTAYGKAVLEVLADTFDDADKKYGQDALDRIDGFLKGWEKKHAALGEDAKAAAEADKIAILEKAQAALK